MSSSVRDPFLGLNSTPVALTKVLGLQQEQPQLYETLTKPLNSEEQQVLQAAIHQADAIQQQQQAALAAASQQTNGQQH